MAFELISIYNQVLDDAALAFAHSAHIDGGSVFVLECVTGLFAFAWAPWFSSRFTAGEDQSVTSSASYILELPGWVQHTQLPLLKVKRLPVSFWANSTQLEYITCRWAPIVMICSPVRNQSKFLTATNCTLGQVPPCPSNTEEFFSCVRCAMLVFALNAALAAYARSGRVATAADSRFTSIDWWKLGSEDDWHHHPSSTSQHSQHYSLHTSGDWLQFCFW